MQAVIVFALLIGRATAQPHGHGCEPILPCASSKRHWAPSSLPAQIPTSSASPKELGERDSALITLSPSESLLLGPSRLPLSYLKPQRSILRSSCSRRANPVNHLPRHQHGFLASAEPAVRVERDKRYSCQFAVHSARACCPRIQHNLSAGVSYPGYRHWRPCKSARVQSMPQNLIAGLSCCR
jgi:hypothetical protein